MAGAIRRFPFLADAEAIRLVCHPDAMTPDANPLLGPLPGVRGFWVAAGSVAQRVRRRGRDRPGDGRLDHGRRSGRGHRAVPGVAVRRRLPRPRFRGRAGARDVLRLLPAPLPVRRGPGRPAAAAVRAPRAAPGGRRGVRHQGRLGTCRLPRAGPPVAPRRARPGRVRLDPAAVVRARRRGGAGRPRAGGDHRPVVVRQDRRRGAGSARPAPAGERRTTSTAPSGASSTRSGATSAAGWWPT